MSKFGEITFSPLVQSAMDAIAQEANTTPTQYTKFQGFVDRMMSNTAVKTAAAVVVLFTALLIIYRTFFKRPASDPSPAQKTTEPEKQGGADSCKRASTLERVITSEVNFNTSEIIKSIKTHDLTNIGLNFRLQIERQKGLPFSTNDYNSAYANREQAELKADNHAANIVYSCSNGRNGHLLLSGTSARRRFIENLEDGPFVSYDVWGADPLPAGVMEDGKVDSAIVVQGWKEGEAYPLDAEGIASDALNVHYIANQIRFVDVQLVFQSTQSADKATKDRIIANIKKCVPKECYFRVGQKTFPNNEIEAAVQEAMKKPQRFIIVGELSKEIALTVKFLLEKSFAQDSVFLRQVECSKNCDAMLLSKENLKSAILFGVNEVLEGRDVDVFCHQGKDRSGIVALGVLAVLAGVTYPEVTDGMNEPEYNQAYSDHNSVAKFLIQKRHCVNNDYVFTWNERIIPVINGYRSNMVEAVKEIQLELTSD